MPPNEEQHEHDWMIAFEPALRCDAFGCHHSEPYADMTDERVEELCEELNARGWPGHIDCQQLKDQVQHFRGVQ